MRLFAAVLRIAGVFALIAPAMAGEGVTSTKNVVFIHPDLGIGGAERLIIDAAVGLKDLGHNVTIFTSYCDPGHAFEETQDGTVDVRVRGDTLFPPAIGGRLSILFSILRQLSLVLTSAVFTNELHKLEPDIFIFDQLSACIPLVRLLFPKARVMFYGHYPDQLLLRTFGSGIMRPIRMAYRVPFDAIEGWTTGCADAMVVNSKFTRGVFRKTFPYLRDREFKVIYPCVNTDDSELHGMSQPIWPDKKLLLSVNRWECKKDLALAVKAYAGLTAEERIDSKLVLAGGFDPRNPENSECYDIIRNLTQKLGLTHKTARTTSATITDWADEDADVFFLLSIPHELKARLIGTATMLVYTPSDEHFGIVPLEAMVAGVPVLATNTGGPLETISDGKTGWHRDPNNTSAWTDVMRNALDPSNAEALERMGEQGRQRAQLHFSRTNMTDDFNREIHTLSNKTWRRPQIAPDWVWYLLTSIFVGCLGILALYVSYIPPARRRGYSHAYTTSLSGRRLSLKLPITAAPRPINGHMKFQNGHID